VNVSELNEPIRIRLLRYLVYETRECDGDFDYVVFAVFEADAN
jgi:hypothetical protein